MPEESKDLKAKKLAAARKKLKEYQQRGSPAAAGMSGNSNQLEQETTSNHSGGHLSSNISERSDSELHLNGSHQQLTELSNSMETELRHSAQNVTDPQMQETHNSPSESVLNIAHSKSSQETQADSLQNLNAIQVLITEKAQLTAELSKYKNTCREKDMELEELRVQYTNTTKRNEDMVQRLVDMQKQTESQRSHNAELQHKLAQARAQQEDHSTHVSELKQQLSVRDEKLKQLEHDLKESSTELELSQLRVRQLSDENSITKDNRVETLTQTQFMYEQQIRDLQAMVQQLQLDKEQANTQYQTYVQQLNAQVNQLTERNIELVDECSKLQDRDKQLVDHIQQLERDIQKNLSRQAELKEEKQKQSNAMPENPILADSPPQELSKLEERLSEFETERYEFQLKIKSQEDHLLLMQQELQQKQFQMKQMQIQMEQFAMDQPDKSKLLATMESDKIAASRALTQNVELKKQLEELEQRFVQLTNDKADLMNRLDSEQYANREMHANYGAMEERVRSIDERFKYKDEEMIRLSIENEQLKKKNLLLAQGMMHEEYENYDEHDGGEHGHDHEYEHETAHEHQHDHGHKHDHEDHGHAHEHDHDHKHEHDHDHKNEHDGDHKHNNCNNHADAEHQHDHDHHHQHNNNNDEHADSCQEAKEADEEEYVTPKTSKPKRHSYAASKHSAAPQIATEEAVEKLQQRFTQLISQVADLTDEKQRLEHLVMQLQSETETIGEYIALYQTQRRILKQREYEKAAQTELLQAEREKMRERLTILNNLVNSLGMMDMGMATAAQQQNIKQQINEAYMQSLTTTSLEEGEELQENASTETTALQATTTTTGVSDLAAKDLNSEESQKILHKIQDIITEIKENTKELPQVTHTVDQLKCCLGKFEVV